MKTLTVALTFALSLTTLSAQNLTTTPVLVVPGVAKVAGVAGSFFHTSLWMTNPNDAPIVVRLRFVPGAGFTRAGAVDTDPITIAPHTMMTFDDLLTDAFHATSNTGGVAIVEAADIIRPFNWNTFASSRLRVRSDFTRSREAAKWKHHPPILPACRRRYCST